MSDSVVRQNLMSYKNYTPYCGSNGCDSNWPRTMFKDDQFECSCGWRSNYEPFFIEEYKAVKDTLK